MKIIAIVHGEPRSINSEIILKSWKNLSEAKKKSIIIIGNKELISAQLRKLRSKVKINIVNENNLKIKKHNLNLLDVSFKFKNPFNTQRVPTAKYIKKCLNLADDLARSRKIFGVINCSIDKKIFKKRMGVTEYLSLRNKLKEREVMLIHNKKFSVAPITTHLEVRRIQRNISKEKIIKKTKTVHSFFKNKFKKNAKLAILGLNPHNDEFRSNSFENKILVPSIKILKNIGINIKGPFSVDEIFLGKNFKFDAIIGMYHDQVLGPFKALYKFDAINITLGLPYLRVSPDHGTAIKIINKGKADPRSLNECIEFLLKI